MRTILLGFLLLACATAVAQDNNSSAPPAQTQQSPGTPNPAPAKKGKPDATRDEKFSTAVAEALMNRIAQGLIRKNPKLFLSAFEPSRLPDYATFADRATATLDQNASFRVYFHVLDASEQDGSGTAMVDVQVERNPQISGAAPQRSQATMHLDCERGANGWRIVQFSPADFFSKL